MLRAGRSKLDIPFSPRSPTTHGFPTSEHCLKRKVFWLSLPPLCSIQLFTVTEEETSCVCTNRKV